MPYRWEPDVAPAGRYRNTRSGEFVSARGVRAALDVTLRSAADPVVALADQLRNGQVSIATWELAMRDQIKAANISAIQLERGGRANMTPADYGRAGQIIRGQYGYLNNFAGDIQSGKQRLDGTLQRRMKMYTDNARGSFYASADANMLGNPTHERSIIYPGDSCPGCISENRKRWQILGQMIPIGQRDCFKNCRCTKEWGRMSDGTIVTIGAM